MTDTPEDPQRTSERNPANSKSCRKSNFLLFFVIFALSIFWTILSFSQSPPIDVIHVIVSFLGAITFSFIIPFLVCGIGYLIYGSFHLIKDRKFKIISISKFINILFIVTIIGFALSIYGLYGSLSHEDGLNESVFYENEFYIDFPGEPERAVMEMEEIEVITYAATDGTSNYYVKIGKLDQEMTELLTTKPAAAEYFLTATVDKLVPINAESVENISIEKMLFFDQYTGVTYKNSSIIDGETNYHKGIFFIKDDGSTMQVSINYPEYLDIQIDDNFNHFVTSLTLH